MRTGAVILSKCLTFNEKIVRHANAQKRVSYTQSGKKAVSENGL